MPDEQTIQLREVLKEELKTFHEETLMPAFGAYTEAVVLPAIERVREEIKEVDGRLTRKIGELRSDMIDFITKQNMALKAEILQAYFF